ncbi:hypothetical protein FVB9288_02620 [Flavobacterium sp. CECT 9288]|uniref:carboxypeptidase-like regulatory domain-containing protein n=1 Tax=Flavobacterium sp. CECT 9288 TaxID=2845819 RepID=UPI001E514E54|nr:carboxypeptidase-like regulatory domain-containing protein [Flavobacterium sp. CECT 9288]CAH0336893.1 hypothetical protein FVB9288_02620 [Flavobacterium sp. CECT 9288]
MRHNKFKIVFCVLFLFQIAFGQSTVEKVYSGKVIVSNQIVAGVIITNKKTGLQVRTNPDGFFSMAVHVKDTLVFEAVHLQKKQIIILDADLEKADAIIEMQLKNTVLKEVVVNGKKIDAYSLGIASKNTKKFTPAERKLQTAGDWKPIMLLGLLGGSMELDPLINKINGRTKRLKKLIVLEKKELNIKWISEEFQDAFFINQLGIKQEYISGFKYYLVENDSFTKTLLTRDKDQIIFSMIPLAQEYKDKLKGN